MFRNAYFNIDDDERTGQSKNVNTTINRCGIKIYGKLKLNAHLVPLLFLTLENTYSFKISRQQSKTRFSLCCPASTSTLKKITLHKILSGHEK